MTLLIKEIGSFDLLPAQSYADVANPGGKDTTEDTMWQFKVQWTVNKICFFIFLLYVSAVERVEGKKALQLSTYNVRLK